MEDIGGRKVAVVKESMHSITNWYENFCKHGD